MLTNERIKEIIVQPEKHIDEIIGHIDDIFDFIVSEETYLEPEISLTRISNVFSMRCVELHFCRWKMFKAELSLVVPYVEPERHEALNALSKKEFKLLLASLKNVLDYKKCVFQCNKNMLDEDEISSDEEFMNSRAYHEMEV
jgi:hypothetical protein